MAATAVNNRPAEVVKPARKSRKVADPNETAADKFRRLANHRVPRVLKLINSVGQLGNKVTYESTDEQRNAIKSAINAAIKSAFDRLDGAKLADVSFKL